MFIFITHEKLIKIIVIIHRKNVREICYNENNVRLQRQKVKIKFRNLIEVFDIDDDTIFSIIVKHLSSYYEYRIIIKCELIKSFHFSLFMKFIERLVNNIFILLINKIYTRKLNYNIRL